MTPIRPSQRRRWATFACAGAALAPCLALASSPSQLLYERALMSAAGARCNLFVPAITSALAVTAAQARGAALRQGDSEQDVAAVIARARAKAASTPCDSGDIVKAAANVRDVFADFAQMTRQTYPGDLSVWTADRASRTWRLSEPGSIGSDKILLGIPAGAGGLTAVVSLANGPMPYSARLVLRDPARTQGPYLDRSLAPGAARLPYAARLAPANVTTSFLAASRSAAEPALLPSGTSSGWRFGFSAAASDALAALDPREAVSIEFLFSDNRGGETRRIAYAEVGDFAAGRAFASLAAN